MTVGRRVRNVDWANRTAGLDAYVADIRLPEALVARVLRSPHPHARIQAIDTSRAERAPGVAAVVTAADLDPETMYVHHGPPLADRAPLARGVVRFVGEEVAAVAAETRSDAETALRLISVRYRTLPSVLSTGDALDPRSPAIHDRPFGHNLAGRIERHYGDAVAAAASARTTVSGRYRFGRQTHACMEPNSVLARWDEGEEQLELWTSTQAPYFIRKEVAHVLGLHLDQVVTHEVAVGGGFGSKSKISDHEVIASLLSIKSRRPVRLVLDRDEEFACTKCRHAFEMELDGGVDASGALTHRSARIVVDNGAYNHSGPSVMGYGTLVLASLYRTAAIDIDARLVDTNKHPGGQFRGYGGPQVTFAIESQMDELADAAGMDPIDFRVRNANRPGDVTHAGWRIRSSGLVECLEAVRDEIGWDRKRALAGSGRGVGVAAAIHVSGAHVYEGAERGDAGVDVLPGGRVRVRFGGADPGTGQKTVLAQIACHELGVDIGTVDVVTMESAGTPLDLGAWSSRGTVVSGGAVRAAARTAADRLRALAATKFGVDPSDVRLGNGEAAVAEHSIRFGDLLALDDDLVDGELRVEETFSADMEPVNPATGVSNLSAAYSFAAHGVEVEVDRESGQVRVVRVVAAHDAGTIVNPIAAESQIIGGVAMGLGAALGEELLYQDGRMINPAYLHYPLLRARDTPSISAIVVEHADPATPYGAKGLGEISLVPTTAAVANAVAHATGVRIRELPITPDKVLLALRANQSIPPRAYHLWRRPNRWEVSLVRGLYRRGLHRVLHRWGTRLSRPSTPREIDEVRRPRTVDEAVSMLKSRACDTSPIGGGTDLLPARRQGLAQSSTLVDLCTVRPMRVIAEDEHGNLHIGGAATLAELERLAENTGDHAIAETIKTIASEQIRQMATVAGNLCQQKRCWFFRNGFNCYKRGGFTCPCYAVLGDHRFYHAALGARRCQAVTPSDLATVLLALDGHAIIASGAGARTLTMARFYKGPGEPALRPGEIVTEVVVPASARRRTTVFEKLRQWEGDFAVVSAAASLDASAEGTIVTARLTLGAIAPTPYRAIKAEKVLVGSRADAATIGRAATAWTTDAHPLPNNEWKLDAAEALLRRALERCVDLRRRPSDATEGGQGT